MSERSSKVCEHVFPAGFEVAKPDRRSESIEKAVSAMHLSLLIMSLLAVTVGIFIIFNSLSVSVNQRWKEIGVLRSIGVEGHRVQKMFLVEAVVLGLVGSAVGVGLGFVLAGGAVRVMSNVSATFYGLASTPQASDVSLGLCDYRFRDWRRLFPVGGLAAGTRGFSPQPRSGTPQH